MSNTPYCYTYSYIYQKTLPKKVKLGSHLIELQVTGYNSVHLLHNKKSHTKFIFMLISRTD